MPVKGGFGYTKKQREIMLIIVEAASRGETITMAQLKGKLSYGAKVTDQAITGSLNFLAKHGYVRKQLNGPRSMTLLPTAAAFRRFKVNHYPEPF